MPRSPGAGAVICGICAICGQPFSGSRRSRRRGSREDGTRGGAGFSVSFSFLCPAPSSPPAGGESGIRRREWGCPQITQMHPAPSRPRLRAVICGISAESAASRSPGLGARAGGVAGGWYGVGAGAGFSISYLLSGKPLVPARGGRVGYPAPPVGLSADYADAPGALAAAASCRNLRNLRHLRTAVLRVSALAPAGVAGGGSRSRLETDSADLRGLTPLPAGPSFRVDMENHSC
jgi:hypothetical protein